MLEDFADAPLVDPAAMTDLHPLDAFEQLRHASMPTARPEMPHLPNAPAMQPEGDGLRGLLKMMAPMIGALAMKGGAKQTGFMNGYSEGQQAVEQDKQRKAEEANKRSMITADYVQKISEQADQITDPAQWSHFVETADATAARAKLTQPGEIKSQLAFPRNRLAAQQLKELTDQLASFEKGGYNLDDLAQSGAVLQLRDGTNVPIAAAMDIAHARPMANGAPVPRPGKQDANAATDYGRFLARYAKDQGTTVDKLTAKDELAARAQYDQAGNKPPAPPHVAAGGVDAQYADLVELWKLGHPGKEPPADVRTKLRTQANTVNDKAPTGMGGGAGNSALDPDGVDYAATEYRVTGKMPPLGMGNGAARSAIINTAAKQARMLGQSPAAAIQKQYAYKGDATALTKMTTMSAAAESFESKALAQADIIDTLSAKVSRSQWPIINDAIISGKTKLLGDSNAQQLANAIETFSAEYAKIIEGSTGSAAGSSDSSRKASSRLINTSFNKGTMADVLNLMRREMRLTVQGYDATKAHITERMGGQAPPAASGGGTAAGKSYVLVNGKWVLQ